MNCALIQGQRVLLEARKGTASVATSAPPPPRGRGKRQNCCGKGLRAGSSGANLFLETCRIGNRNPPPPTLFSDDGAGATTSRSRAQRLLNPNTKTNPNPDRRVAAGRVGNSARERSGSGGSAAGAGGAAPLEPSRQRKSPEGRGVKQDCIGSRQEALPRDTACHRPASACLRQPSDVLPVASSARKRQ